MPPLRCFSDDFVGFPIGAIVQSRRFGRLSDNRRFVGVDRIKDMAYVYILKSENGVFYVGSTDDLERRLRQHVAGHTQTTRQKKINKLVFKQEFDTLEAARKMEIKIKKWKRRDYVEKIIEDGYIKKAS